jgi:hypothetical protein
MRTIALRFANHFAPPEGTIYAHEKMIYENGFVWYGKIGQGISEKTREIIMSNNPCRILLIHSGSDDRYWANIREISKSIPQVQFIPEYYKDKYDKAGVWFCVTGFYKAPSDVMKKCRVVSSGRLLSEASKRCMNPVFLIDYEEA